MRSRWRFPLRGGAARIQPPGRMRHLLGGPRTSWPRPSPPPRGGVPHRCLCPKTSRPSSSGPVDAPSSSTSGPRGARPCCSGSAAPRAPQRLRGRGGCSSARRFAGPSGAAEGFMDRYELSYPNLLDTSGDIRAPWACGPFPPPTCSTRTAGSSAADVGGVSEQTLAAQLEDSLGS